MSQRAHDLALPFEIPFVRRSALEQLETLGAVAGWAICFLFLVIIGTAAQAGSSICSSCSSSKNSKGEQQKFRMPSQVVACLSPAPQPQKSQSAEHRSETTAQQLYGLIEACSAVNLVLAPYAYETLMKRAIKEALEQNDVLKFASIVDMDIDGSDFSSPEISLGAVPEARLSHDSKIALQHRFISSNLDAVLRSADAASHDQAQSMVKALSTIRVVDQADKAEIDALLKLVSLSSADDVALAREYMMSDKCRLKKAWAIFPGLIKFNVAATNFLKLLEADSGFTNELAGVARPNSPEELVDIVPKFSVADAQKAAIVWGDFNRKLCTITANASPFFLKAHAVRLEGLSQDVHKFQELMLARATASFDTACLKTLVQIGGQLDKGHDAVPRRSLPDDTFVPVLSALAMSACDIKAIEQAFTAQQIETCAAAFAARREFREAFQAGSHHLMEPVQQARWATQLFHSRHNRT